VPPPPGGGGGAPTTPAPPTPSAAWVIPPSAAAQAAVPLPRGAIPGGVGPSSFGGTAIPDDSPLAAALAARRRLDATHRRVLDALAPRTVERWVGLCVGLGLFALRIVLVQGYYIIAYMLAIFLLNQLLLFLQPKDRATLLAAVRGAGEAAAGAAGISTGAAAGGTTGGASGGGGGGGATADALPTRDTDEFRPFVRRLPEFTFWYGASVTTTLALLATAFPIFDIPVFWPVLVVYFIMLFAVTMRRQWQDMKKLRYVPWDIGQKRRYGGGKDDPRRVSASAAAANDAVPAVSAGTSYAPPPSLTTVSKKGGGAATSAAPGVPPALPPPTLPPASTPSSAVPMAPVAGPSLLL